jgi:HK97 gp10 family phage protein
MHRSDAGLSLSDILLLRSPLEGRMMSDAITIDGLAELSQLLTELAPAAAKRYLSRCAEPAAQVVLDAMAETVPVGVGILEEQLGWQKHWSSDGDQTTMVIEIGPLKPAFWGSFQEFGTATQPAQHWFGNAWMGCRDKCLDVFATECTGLLMDLENKK